MERESRKWNPIQISFPFKFFQQFAVDAHVKVEQNRLNTRVCIKLSFVRLPIKRSRLIWMAKIFPDKQVIEITWHLFASALKGDATILTRRHDNCSSIRKASIVLTATCNPQWREIQEICLRDRRHQIGLTSQCVYYMENSKNYVMTSPKICAKYCCQSI